MAVANYLGLTLEQIPIGPAECRTADYRLKNPNGKVPTLEDGDFFLWESNAIMFYLTQKVRGQNLMPGKARLRTELWRWLSWSMCHWAPTLHKLVHERMVKPAVLGLPPDCEALERAEHEFHRLASILDQHLASRPFVLGRKLNRTGQGL